MFHSYHDTNNYKFKLKISTNKQVNKSDFSCNRFIGSTLTFFCTSNRSFIEQVPIRYYRTRPFLVVKLNSCVVIWSILPKSDFCHFGHLSWNGSEWNCPKVNVTVKFWKSNTVNASINILGNDLIRLALGLGLNNSIPFSEFYPKPTLIATLHSAEFDLSYDLDQSRDEFLSFLLKFVATGISCLSGKESRPLPVYHRTVPLPVKCSNGLLNK